MGLKRVIQDVAESAKNTGLFQAGLNAIKGQLSDQWLEAIEPHGMGEGVVFCSGARVRPGDERAGNRQSTEDLITNGSHIHVYDNQAMLLVENGAIIDFSAEPGRFEVDNSSSPSLFTGDLAGTVRDTFERFKFAGGTPNKQLAFYVNLQEIKGIRFGTPQSINYFDNFYNAELFLRCHGTFSLKIVDPILFYREAIPRSASLVHIDQIKEQYLSEFLEALQAAINQMSVDGVRVSQIVSKTVELSKYMRDALDAEWLARRGMEVSSVGIASLSYDEESRKIIDMRSQAGVFTDPSVREAYVQTSVARGLEAAGSNEAGAAAAFLGMGIGMQSSGGFMQAASHSNQASMAAQQAAAQQPAQQPPAQQAGAGGAVPGASPTNGEAGGTWGCPTCNIQNTGKFCPSCGQARPAPAAGGFCGECGQKFDGERPRFCPECGSAQN